MTLHQQHEKAMIESSDSGMFEATVVEAAAEVSKEYAKGFVSDLRKNFHPYIDAEGNKWQHHLSDEVFTTDQLLSLYDDHLAKLEKEKIK